MGPTSPLGQISQSMASGQSPLNQISNSSPAAQPGLMPPPAPPMPEKSPASEIHDTPLHRAFARRGKMVPQQLNDFISHQPYEVKSAYRKLIGTDPTQINNEMAAQSSLNQPQPTQPSQQPEVPLTEAEKIVGVLGKRLEHHNKMAEKLVDTFLNDSQKKNDLSVSPESGGFLNNNPMTNTLADIQDSGGRPQSQIDIERALNSGNFQGAQAMVSQLPALDPYKKTMTNVLAMAMNHG